MIKMGIAAKDMNVGDLQEQLERDAILLHL